jgi:hypothetical protein
MLRTVHAARYVLPDLGLYVVKLRGASQGPEVLVAELLAGEIARAAGLQWLERLLDRVVRTPRRG